MRQSVDIRLPEHISRRFEAQLRHLVRSQKNKSFKGAYLFQEFGSKYLDESLVPASVRAEAAIEKFLSAEQRNATTNTRLVCRLDPYSWGWTSHERLLKTVRDIIRTTLGSLPYPAILHRSVYTNGASTRVRRSPAASVLKLTGEVDISSSAIKHWLQVANGNLLSEQVLNIQEESILFTVPKKTEIDRCACKEPEGNMLLQRSVGIYIRDRLRKVGINLRDQSVNRQLAREGVRRGLATVDLSSASDLISHGLVATLLPWDWYILLDDLRVKATILPDGKVHELEMFSSMGNGFTFELETLIFYAIARAIARLSGVKGRISVFGDDIILPAILVGRLGRVFSFFGFVLNQKKTNARGLFRESCGGHYWDGLDVTPFYLRGVVRDLPTMIGLLNRVLEWDSRENGFLTTKEIAIFWQRWKTFIPEFLWGGVDFNDVSCLVTGDAPRKRLIARTGKMTVSEEGRSRDWFLRAERRQWSDEPLTVTPQFPRHTRVEEVESAGVRAPMSLKWDQFAF